LGDWEIGRLGELGEGVWGDEMCDWREKLERRLERDLGSHGLWEIFLVEVTV
jgi:hypothetical protein